MNEQIITFIGTNQLLASQFKSNNFIVEEFGRNTFPNINLTDKNLDEQISSVLANTKSNKFIISSGLLQSKQIVEQDFDERINSFLINSIGPVLVTEYILKKIDDSRVYIMGSESGYKGSFDLTYALAKSSLRMYVRQRSVKENQQLLLISPSTIEDWGMTKRRNDIDNLKTYKNNHPKKRFLNSSEIFDILNYLLSSPIYLTNTEIEINGGKFALMKSLI